MTDTLTPSQRSQLIDDIRRITKHGGPEWYAWCGLEEGIILGPERPTDDDGGVTWDEVESPPAVAAAVIAWAANLHKWAYSQGFGGRLCLVSCGTATVLDEALALISAVAERLEQQ